MSTNARATFRRLKVAIAVGAIAAALAGCNSTKWGFPYKAPVQQGNWITSEQVALLRVGMTRDQVRFALGSPTLTSVLHADRWDYPYYFKPGYGSPQERKFTVWFDNDKVVRWEGDKQPDVQPFQLAVEEGKASNAQDGNRSAATQNPATPSSPAGNVPAGTPPALPATQPAGTSPAVPSIAPARTSPSAPSTAPAGTSSATPSTAPAGGGLPAGVTTSSEGAPSGTTSGASTSNSPGASTQTTQ